MAVIQNILTIIKPFCFCFYNTTDINAELHFEIFESYPEYFFFYNCWLFVFNNTTDINRQTTQATTGRGWHPYQIRRCWVVLHLDSNRQQCMFQREHCTSPIIALICSVKSSEIALRRDTLFVMSHNMFDVWT